jgi:conjugal transfer/entry exclusion protein
MKDEEKTKVQLIKEMQKMREKVAGLEEVKLEYNQVDKTLKQTYKKLQKFIEGTAYIIIKNYKNL